MSKKVKNPTRASRAQRRVEMAYSAVQGAEMRFDARINDDTLKNAIESTFHEVDEQNRLIKYVHKEERQDFLDNPYFCLLSERQYRAVVLYIDALIELTFAQSKLWGLPIEEEVFEGDFSRF